MSLREAPLSATRTPLQLDFLMRLTIWLAFNRTRFNVCAHGRRFCSVLSGAYNPAKRHFKIAQRRAGGPQSSVLLLRMAAHT
jgi:hypothetical protein